MFNHVAMTPTTLLTSVVMVAGAVTLIAVATKS